MENNLDKQYLDLLKDILENGVVKKDRTGTGTISVFGRQIRHKMSDGFPILTSKKMHLKSIATELLWFLRGDTNIKYLLDNDCNIWNGDAYKSYLNKRTTANKDNVREPHTLKNGMTGEISRAYTKEEFVEKIKTDDEFAKKWGDLGPIYGYQWRSWGGTKKVADGWQYGIPFSYKKVPVNDQIVKLINTLKTNPDDRGMIVSAWNVDDLERMKLRPCHYNFQLYTRELSQEERQNIWNKNNFYVDISWHNMTDIDIVNLLSEANIPTRTISLMWSQRSCDFPLGIPYNIASYGLLLEIIAKEVNMIPDELIGSLGDCHIYLNQVDGCKEQISRGSYELPKLNFSWYVESWATETAKKLREDCFDAYIRQMKPTDFSLENYQSYPTIKFPLSN